MTPGSSRGITRAGPRTVDFSGCGSGSPRTCAAPEVTTVISSGRRQVLVGHRLRQEQQRVEALLLVAVEEARARAERLAVGHQPEVRDAGRHRAARDEIADERVVAVASALGRQDVAALAGAAEGVAGVDLDHLMAGGAQAVADAGAEPRHVDEHEPGLRRDAVELGLDVDRAVGEPRPPERAPAPGGDVVLAHRSSRRSLDLGGAGRDEVRRPLEGVGRQRHAGAPGAAPDRLPVEGDADGPEPAEDAEEVRVVGDALLRVAQRAQDLVRAEPRRAPG